MSWLGGITDSVDVSELQDMVEHKGVWHAAVHGGCKELDTTEQQATLGNVWKRFCRHKHGDGGEMVLPSIQWAEARDAANILQSTGQPLASQPLAPTNTYHASNVNSTAAIPCSNRKQKWSVATEPCMDIQTGSPVSWAPSTPFSPTT